MILSLNRNVLCKLSGAREFVTATRKTGPDDPLNSAAAGFGTGAILGRLQGFVLLLSLPSLAACL